MKKHVRKSHSKKNHNYKNVKENKNMKNGRRLTEVENMLFTLQMQNELGDAEHMKNLVHKDLFDNLRVLMENEGFDMSFMDDPVARSLTMAACLDAKRAIEKGEYYTDKEERRNMVMVFGMYMENADEEYVNVINENHWESRMYLFVGHYAVCLAEHYEDRDLWIRTLAMTAETYKKINHKIAYERTMNYLSLFVLNVPTITLTRDLSAIVDEHIKNMSA